MKFISLHIVLLMLAETALGQAGINIPCSLDTAKMYEINIDLAYYDNTLHTEIEVSNYQTLCIPQIIKYNATEKKYYTQDEHRYAIDPAKITSLAIRISGTRNFDMSQSPLLNTVDVAMLSSLSVSGNNNYDLMLHLKQWPHYNALNKHLCNVCIEATGITDANLFDDIKDYKNIEHLIIPQYINQGLYSFRHIREIKSEQAVYFFSNNLVQLASLVDFDNSSESIFDFYQPESMYAQKYFFFNYLNTRSEDHPVYIIDSLYELKHPDGFTGTGNVAIISGDIYSIENNTDTIAVGKITDGKKTGTWKYRLNPNAADCYYYNYDLASHTIDFPANGHWQYNYENGKVAIEGFFKEGKKEGVWKFYAANGNIADVKTYENDQPKGLFIEYKKEQTIRKYYSDEFNYIGAIESTGKSDLHFFTVKQNGIVKNGYNSDSNENLVLWTDNKPVKTIAKNSTEYKNIINHYFLTYLYADK